MIVIIISLQCFINFALIRFLNYQKEYYFFCNTLLTKLSNKQTLRMFEKVSAILLAVFLRGLKNVFFCEI